MNAGIDSTVDVVLATHLTSSGRTARLLSAAENVRAQHRRTFTVSFDNLIKPDFLITLEIVDNLEEAFIKLLPFVTEVLDLMEPVYFNESHCYFVEMIHGVLENSQSVENICMAATDSGIMTELVRVLAKENRNYLKKGVDDAISDHVGFFNGEFPATVEKMKMFFDIVSMQDGFECYYYRLFFPEANNVDFTDEGVRTFFHLGYSVQIVSFPELDESMRVVDFPLVDLKDPEGQETDAFLNIFNLPIELPGFRQYALNLTLGEFRQLFTSLSRHMSTELAILVSKQAVENYRLAQFVEPIDSFAFANSTAQKIFPLIPTGNVADAVDYYGIIMRNYKKVSGVKIIKAALDAGLGIKKNFYELMVIFLGTVRTNQWIANFQDTELVFQMLLAKMSELEVLDIVLTTIELSEVPTFEQWQEYTNRYDEFKDTPKSWWVSLV